MGGMEVEGAVGGRAEVQVVLKMWKNGFVVDDGEIRDYNDVRSKMFLASVMAG